MNNFIKMSIEDIKELSNSDILKEATKISISAKNGENYLETKYRSFYVTYPFLFTKIVSSGGNLNMNVLEMMLSLSNDRASGRISQEDANEKVSHKLFNKFK